MSEKLVKIRKAMQENKVDALLVTSMYNLRYIANFTGTTGLAVVTLEKAFFVTDARYTQQATQQAVGFEIVQNRGPILDEVTKLVEQEKIKTLGFEKDHVDYGMYEVLDETINARLEALPDSIKIIREIKTPEEVAIIQKACEIADKGFQHVLETIKVGMTEIEVANDLDFFMRSLGATEVSFNTIVASGVRSSMPHGVASEKLIEQGDLITLDFGCYYQGYVSDMTRTFAIGDPGEKLKEVYEVVRVAQEKVIAAAKPGLSGIELDAVARDYITSRGYGDFFTHTTGHGIGLEIHEGPNVSFRAAKRFVPGNIITDEPGIYLPEIGGVRIEDDLLITENGCEILNHSPKELIIL